MNPVLAELISLLTLERLEDNLFRGSSRDIGAARVYGGQVLGQALKAAQYTVQNRQIHSLHAYFLREGDHDRPIIYEVERSRDGRSFSARRVVATQHGRPIFTLSASFQVAEQGLEYQLKSADVPAPDTLPGVHEYKSRLGGRLPEKFRRLITLSAPFDLRPVEPLDRELSANSKPGRRLWFKTIDKLPDDPDLHRAILAYASDYGLLTATLVPHGIDMFHNKLIMASIDHAMWFHRPFHADAWLLYECEALSTSNSRGLARGTIYQQDGTMIATVTQEGLIRFNDIR